MVEAKLPIAKATIEQAIKDLDAGKITVDQAEEIVNGAIQNEIDNGSLTPIGNGVYSDPDGVKWKFNEATGLWDTPNIANESTVSAGGTEPVTDETSGASQNTPGIPTEIPPSIPTPVAPTAAVPGWMPAGTTSYTGDVSDGTGQPLFITADGYVYSGTGDYIGTDAVTPTTTAPAVTNTTTQIFDDGSVLTTDATTGAPVSYTDTTGALTVVAAPVDTTTTLPEVNVSTPTPEVVADTPLIPLTPVESTPTTPIPEVVADTPPDLVEPTPEIPIFPPIIPVTPPTPPTRTPYGPIDPTTWGKTAGLVNPGLNPGWIKPTLFYNTTSPVQSQYDWSKHPYQPGPTFDPLAYNLSLIHI